MLETKCYACQNNLDFKPWDKGQASFEICPFCKIQFGNDDYANNDKQKRKKIYEKWNIAWIENGKKALSENQRLEVIKSVLKDTTS